MNDYHTLTYHNTRKTFKNKKGYSYLLSLVSKVFESVIMSCHKPMVVFPIWLLWRFLCLCMSQLWQAGFINYRKISFLIFFFKSHFFPPASVDTLSQLTSIFCQNIRSLFVPPLRLFPLISSVCMLFPDISKWRHLPHLLFGLCVYKQWMEMHQTTNCTMCNALN